jgi:hypothetical protein
MRSLQKLGQFFFAQKCGNAGSEIYIYIYLKACGMYLPMLTLDGVYVQEPLIGGKQITSVLNHGFIVVFRVNTELRVGLVGRVL